MTATYYKTVRDLFPEKELMLNAAGSCNVLVCLLNLLLGKGLWADGGTKFFLFAKMAGGGEKPLRPSVFMSESKSDGCLVP